MKKKYQVIGLIVLFVCSVLYNFQKPASVTQENQNNSYVTLEGEFNQTGQYSYEGKKTVGDIINEVGTTSKANLNALNLDKELVDEESLYLPAISETSVSLNNATKEELMTLNRVGEKTALKIIEYRKVNPFLCIEDLMKVPGIGEKTFLKLRDSLCL